MLLYCCFCLFIMYIQRDAQKHIVFEVRFRYLRASKSSENLRYEPAVSLSERSLRRSEFEKTAHAFSRFFLP